MADPIVESFIHINEELFHKSAPSLTSSTTFHPKTTNKYTKKIQYQCPQTDIQPSIGYASVRSDKSDISAAMDNFVSNGFDNFNEDSTSQDISTVLDKLDNDQDILQFEDNNVIIPDCDENAVCEKEKTVAESTKRKLLELRIKNKTTPNERPLSDQLADLKDKYTNNPSFAKKTNKEPTIDKKPKKVTIEQTKTDKKPKETTIDKKSKIMITSAAVKKPKTKSLKTKDEVDIQLVNETRKLNMADKKKKVLLQDQEAIKAQIYTLEKSTDLEDSIALKKIKKELVSINRRLANLNKKQLPKLTTQEKINNVLKELETLGDDYDAKMKKKALTRKIKSLEKQKLKELNNTDKMEKPKLQPKKPEKRGKRSNFSNNNTYKNFAQTFVDPSHVLKLEHFQSLEYLFKDNNIIKCDSQYGSRVRSICQFLIHYGDVRHDIENEQKNIINYCQDFDDSDYNSLAPLKALKFSIANALANINLLEDEETPKKKRKTNTECACLDKNLYLLMNLFIVENLKSIFTELNNKQVFFVNPLSKLRLFQTNVTSINFCEDSIDKYFENSNGKIKLQSYYENVNYSIPKCQAREFVFYTTKAIFSDNLLLKDLLTRYNKEITNISAFFNQKKEVENLVAERNNLVKDLKKKNRDKNVVQELQKLKESEEYIILSNKIQAGKIYLKEYTSFESLLKIIYYGIHYTEIGKIIVFLQHQFLSLISPCHAKTWEDFISFLTLNESNCGMLKYIKSLASELDLDCCSTDQRNSKTIFKLFQIHV